MFIELIPYAYCTIMVGYILFFSVMGKFYIKRKAAKSISSYKKIAILIPAYKEDSIIYSSAVSYLNLNYPREAYDIYIIADSLQQTTIQQLSTLPVKVIEVAFEKSTKTKSLNKAFGEIPAIYEIALICDADNILQKDYLQKINIIYQKGAKAIQGQRVAKNMDTSFAILDSISELINNHIFRQGHTVVGLSSSVIGSGMAFDFLLLRDIMGQINAVGGFDKVLQLLITERKIKVKYLPDALIFDEKISHAVAFGHQRRRWLSSQFLYLKKYFFKGWAMLFKGNVDYFNLAVMHNIILPRVILLALLPALAILATIFHAYLYISPVWWWLLVVVYMLSLLIALPRSFFQPQILRSLLDIPKVIFIMLKSMLRIKGANKTFIHTTHQYQEINNPLYKNEAV